MYSLRPTNQFKKDVKKLKRQSAKNGDLIITFLELLTQSGVKGINNKYHPHKLSGHYTGSWEAHIKPDMLIIWFEITEEREIILLRAGSHSDLF